ncbi:MAG: hypothetical protein PHU85_08210 [Phycisphaerae bacterium]|nr:hypothetical protein [Phycisphaerae bacterium]
MAPAGNRKQRLVAAVRRVGSVLRAIGHVFPILVKRAWALLILGVLLGAGYLALDYLARLVFKPPVVPSEFVLSAEPIKADALRKDHVAGVTDRPERAPLAHYHGVDRWFRPDHRDGCTVAGCHDPLPHTKQPAMRAFTNLHATFIACQTCHTTDSQRPAALAWAPLAGGGASEPPAILRLNQLLQNRRAQITDQPRDVHGEMVALLRQTIAVAGGDPVLEYLLLQIETAEPGSPVWRHAVDQLSAEAPQHARGDYGAKLTPTSQADDGSAERKAMSKLTKAYLATKDAAERKRLEKQLHASIAAKPGGCLVCHGDQPPRVDFAAVGYGKERAAALSRLSLADQIQRIRLGEEFHLPRLLEDKRE